MTQNFDDFTRQHEDQQRNQNRLTNETKPEWEILKGLVLQFALDNKGIDERKFGWAKSLSGHPCLVLGYVAATFSDRGERNGVPQYCEVLFSRKEGIFVMDSPVANQKWSLSPEIRDDEFAWVIRESGKVLSSAQLAEEIATELAKYHLNYEQQARKAIGNL